MGEVFLDAFLDSLKILAFLLVCRFVIALIEPKMSESVKLKGKLAPLIGVSVARRIPCDKRRGAPHIFGISRQGASYSPHTCLKICAGRHYRI